MNEGAQASSKDEDAPVKDKIATESGELTSSAEDAQASSQGEIVVVDKVELKNGETNGQPNTKTEDVEL
jgi:hypothetical protein